MAIVLSVICLMFYCYSGSVVGKIGIQTVNGIDEEEAVEALDQSASGATISADGVPIVVGNVQTAAAAAGGMYSGL